MTCSRQWTMASSTRCMVMIQVGSKIQETLKFKAIMFHTQMNRKMVGAAEVPQRRWTGTMSSKRAVKHHQNYLRLKSMMWIARVLKEVRLARIRSMKGMNNNRTKINRKDCQSVLKILMKNRKEVNIQPISTQCIKFRSSNQRGSITSLPCYMNKAMMCGAPKSPKK